MATDKQFEANRQNAQKSTGPKTPEGRAAVRLNGVTHGLTAETIVLKGESQSDFTNLLASLEAEHDPASPTEEALVVQLAMATWRLRRLYHQEAGFYTCQLQSLVGMQKDLNLDDAGRMGHAAAWSPAWSAPSTAPSTSSRASVKSGSPIWLRFCKQPQKSMWGRSPTCRVV